ncbi:hypothetical protein MMC29_007043 [Sticta canariensis]|nr:hypothetical protein [Sticta canariensis]
MRYLQNRLVEPTGKENSAVQHVKRHRDIASLVRGILHLDDARARTSLLRSRTKKARKDDAFEFLKLDTGSIDEIGESEEWQDTDTVCDDDVDVDGQTSGLAETRENMDFMKIQKAERKIVHCQSRFQITTAEELQRVEDALHPARGSLYKNGGGHLESNRLTNSATIDTNIAFNSRTFQYSSLRTAVQRKKFEKHNGISSPRSRTPLDGSQMSAILNRLGISTSAASNGTKERTSRLVRLCSAIKKDLDCIENENRETMMRMAGYWRYVNRRTYNAMVRNKELWDWATGAKLEEIEEEESELESIDDGDDQRSTRFSESDTFTETPPLDNWDEDSILGSNNPLHLANLPEIGSEQRGGQMLDNGAIDSSEKSIWSVITEDAPVPATPVKRAAMAIVKKGNASPWAGIKDTRRIPCRSISPPSSRKRLPARSKSPPSPRLFLKKTTGRHPRKYIPIGISSNKPTARTGKSLSNHLADLRFLQPPQTKGPPRKTDLPTKTSSVAATSAKTPFRVTPAAPVNFREVSPDPQDDDTIRVPAAAVRAHSDAPEAVPFKDANNRFSPLVWPERREKMLAGSRKQPGRK